MCTNHYYNDAESEVSKPSTSWQPVSKATLRKTKSETDSIGLEEDADLSNNNSLSVPTSDSESSSPVNLSPIKEEEIEEAADVASRTNRHQETIFNLDLAEQVEQALNSITEANNNDPNGVPDIVVPTPRKKRSFIAKFEKPVDPSGVSCDMLMVHYNEHIIIFYCSKSIIVSEN